MKTEPKRWRQDLERLTPEQNALMSGLVALITAAVFNLRAAVPSGSTLSSTRLALAGVGGFFHFTACPGRPNDGLSRAENADFGLWRMVSSPISGSKRPETTLTLAPHRYLCTLCAFTTASSTVITPLMQLSALWMLPFSTSAAFVGLGAFIRPLHLLAVLLICAGGFLPAAEGSLSSVATKVFWRQRAVRLVVLGELLICCYNVILHQATFSEGAIK